MQWSMPRPLIRLLCRRRVRSPRCQRVRWRSPESSCAATLTTWSSEWIPEPCISRNDCNRMRRAPRLPPSCRVRSEIVLSLAGKTLFITGASRGIGLAIALRAARDGANIAIAAKTEKPHPKLPGTIHTAAEEIEHAGGKALPLAVDVRDETQVKSAIEKTVATFGGIDIVVNNASAVQRTPVVDTDMRRFDLM